MELREFYKESDRPFTVAAELKGHFVEFTIYEGAEYDTKLDPLFVGVIKWDGCSNWDLPQFHFCTKGEARRLGEFLEELYYWAAELMPTNKDMILDKPE